MKEFEVFFDICGKKLKMKVNALDEKSVESIVRNAIVIHKTRLISKNIKYETFESLMKMYDNMMKRFFSKT